MTVTQVLFMAEIPAATLTAAVLSGTSNGAGLERRLTQLESIWILKACLLELRLQLKMDEWAQRFAAFEARLATL